MSIFHLLALLGGCLAALVLIGGLIRVLRDHQRPDYVTFALALLGILLGFGLSVP